MRFELKKEDIIFYKFDLRRFRKEMCEGFGLVSQTGDVDLYERNIPWGTWEPEKGARFPVSFFLGWHGRAFSDRLAEVALNREAAGEMIITSNRRYWDEDALALAQKHRLLLVPLDEIIQVEDGKFLPTPEWNEYLTAFCKMVEMDLPSKLGGAPKADPFEFRRKGQMWMVRFDGKEIFLRDGVGPQHISVLLSQPNRSIYAVDLQMLASKQDPETRPMRFRQGRFRGNRDGSRLCLAFRGKTQTGQSAPILNRGGGPR